MLRALAAALILATPAAAQNACDHRDKVLARLAGKYGEHPVGRGIGHNGRWFWEIFYSAETHTWTVLKSGLDGKSCVMMSGLAWEIIAPQPPGEEG